MKLYTSHFKSFYRLLFAMLTIMVFYSCEVKDTEYEFVDTNPPTSLYSTQPNGLELTFSNESAHATTYLWDFGDGNTSDLENPVHLFASKGEYTVTLTSADNNNITDVYSSMQAVGFPIAVFTYEVEAGAGTVTFTNSSANSSSYIWDFGDGETSTEENPVYTYAEAGSYTVKLTAIEGSDENTAEIEIFVSKKFLPTILSPGFDDPEWATNWNSNAGYSSSKGMDGTGTPKLSAANGDSLSQVLMVDANDSYTISMWVYFRKGSQGATVSIIGADDEIINEQLFTPTEEKSFELFSISFSSGDNTNITLKIADKTGSPAADGGAESWIDNVAIE